MRKSMRLAPQETRLALISLIAGLCRFVDAKRTITTDEDLIFTVEAIVDNYPALTLEEFRLIVDGMKRGQYGKFYERLKLAEIESAIQQYEGSTRAALLEQMNRQGTVERGVEDVSQIKYEPKTMQDVMRERWFKKFKPTTTGGA